jgi:endonuclease/exonuclease/phosphatase family metal-dependent hydrolase
LDQRIKPERIVEVLREIDADIVALQEVVCIRGADNKDDQAHYIARELGLDYRLGENRRHRGGAYGNVVLSRFPVFEARNHDLSVAGREQRGVLRVDVDMGAPLHVYNAHLGTSYFERRRQVHKLLHDEVLKKNDHAGPRVLLGDFNEVVRGLTSRLLSEHFNCADIRVRMGRSRTYPSVLPLVHLDHIYFDDSLELESASLHRSRTAMIASDHLPLTADFRMRNI